MGESLAQCRGFVVGQTPGLWFNDRLELVTDLPVLTLKKMELLVSPYHRAIEQVK